jgi:hypothetical protein
VRDDAMSGQYRHIEIDTPRYDRIARPDRSRLRFRSADFFRSCRLASADYCFRSNFMRCFRHFYSGSTQFLESFGSLFNNIHRKPQAARKITKAATAMARP